QPLPFLTAMHSHLLNGQDLSSLSLKQFSYLNGEGYKYDDYLKYMFTPDLLSKKLFKSSVSYTKGF
ncbi:MAG TPA: hypothetical protein VGH64_16285, partial [Puia sp.]